MMDEKLFNRVPQIRSYRPIIHPDYIVVGRLALSLILAYYGPFDINSDMIIMMPRLQWRGCKPAAISTYFIYGRKRAMDAPGAGPGGRSDEIG